MNLYIISMVLTIGANMAYHLSQKNISSSVNPMVSLVITYLIAIVASLALIPICAPFSQISEGTSLLDHMKSVNWASYMLGLAAVGLEIGFLLAYRAGWQVSVAGLFANAAAALMLCPIGIFFFSEELTVRKSTGFVITLIGLWLLAPAGCTPNHLNYANSADSSNALIIEKVLVVGVSADFPPFEFKQREETVGYDIDVAKAIADELGYVVKFQDMDFSAIIPAVQSGRIDVGIGVTVTEERKKNIDFSDIYFRSAYALITKQESPIQSVNQISGKNLGVQLGTTLEKFAKENLLKTYPSVTLQSLGRFPTLVQELKVDRLDGIVSEEIQAIEFVKANPMMKKIPLGTSNDGYAIALKKGSLETEAFNGAINKLKRRGALDKIYSKWIH